MPPLKTLKIFWSPKVLFCSIGTCKTRQLLGISWISFTVCRVEVKCLQNKPVSLAFRGQTAQKWDLWNSCFRQLHLLFHLVGARNRSWSYQRVTYLKNHYDGLIEMGLSCDTAVVALGDKICKELEWQFFLKIDFILRMY